LVVGIAREEEEEEEEATTHDDGRGAAGDGTPAAALLPLEAVSGLRFTVQSHGSSKSVLLLLLLHPPPPLSNAGRGGAAAAPDAGRVLIVPQEKDGRALPTTAMQRLKKANARYCSYRWHY
jgi:hypothetical protein